MSAPARINGSDLTERHSVIGGGSLTLHCPAAGVPPPHIRWTRDGKYLGRECRLCRVAGNTV